MTDTAIIITKVLVVCVVVAEYAIFCFGLTVAIYLVVGGVGVVIVRVEGAVLCVTSS